MAPQAIAGADDSVRKRWTANTNFLLRSCSITGIILIVFGVLAKIVIVVIAAMVK